MKSDIEKRRRTASLLLKLRKRLTDFRRDQLELRFSAKAQAIKQIAGSLAHDFNNILAVITGNADLGVMSLNTGDLDKAEANFKEIEKASLRARVLTQELLDFSGKRAGTGIPEMVPAPPRSAPAGRFPSHRPLRILIMDDQVMVREMLSEVLLAHGHTVTSASDGETAVLMFEAALASGSRFNAAILDLTVPEGMGGAETVVKLKQLDPELITIATSGYSNDPVIVDCKKYNFDAALVKPYSASDVIKILSEALSSSRQVKPVQADLIRH